MKQIGKRTGTLLSALFCAAVMIHGASAAEPVPAVRELKLSVEGCNVTFKEAAADQMEYDFDSARFNVSAQTTGSTTSVEVTRIQKEGPRQPRQDDRPEIRIPAGAFDVISLDASQAGVSMSGLSAGFSISGRASAFSLALPDGFDKSAAVKLENSSGSILFDSGADLEITLRAETSAVSVPKGWPSCLGTSVYERTLGMGAGKVSVDLTGSAFSLVQRDEQETTK